MWLLHPPLQSASCFLFFKKKEKVRHEKQEVFLLAYVVLKSRCFLIQPLINDLDFTTYDSKYLNSFVLFNFDIQYSLDRFTSTFL